MINNLNINDLVRINMPGYAEDGIEATINEMQVMNGEIYYIGSYHVQCEDGGEGYDQTVQFKEGQYEVLIHTSNGPDYECKDIEDQKNVAEEDVEKQEDISNIEQ